MVRADPRCQLVVVSASRMESARRLAEEVGCEAQEGWEEVVSRPDLDAVVVCTPTHLHATIAIAAMERGKHVLCEKPLAYSVAQAEAMVETARRTGRVLKCGFNHRYHPAVERAKALWDSGALGRPILGRGFYGICGRPGYEREWRANPACTPGGHMVEQGVHLLDLFRWFLGGFQRVAALTQTAFWPISPLEDNGHALLQATSGAVAYVHASLTQWRNRFYFELVGTEGYTIVEGLGGSYGTETLTVGRRDLTGPFSAEITEFRGADPSWRREWDEFVGAVLEGRSLLGTGEDGLEAMRLVEAIYRSAREKAFVELDTVT